MVSRVVTTALLHHLPINFHYKWNAELSDRFQNVVDSPVAPSTDSNSSHTFFGCVSCSYDTLPTGNSIVLAQHFWRLKRSVWPFWLPLIYFPIATVSVGYVDIEFFCTAIWQTCDTCVAFNSLYFDLWYKKSSWVSSIQFLRATVCVLLLTKQVCERHPTSSHNQTNMITYIYYKRKENASSWPDRISVAKHSVFVFSHGFHCFTLQKLYKPSLVVEVRVVSIRWVSVDCGCACFSTVSHSALICSQMLCIPWEAIALERP